MTASSCVIPVRFWAYLRQAIINRIRDEARRAGRSPEVAELDGNQRDRGASPLEFAIGTEAVERYEAALARLRPEEREAVIARVEMDQKFRGIAQGLGKPSRGRGAHGSQPAAAAGRGDETWRRLKQRNSCSWPIGRRRIVRSTGTPPRRRDGLEKIRRSSVGLRILAQLAALHREPANRAYTTPRRVGVYDDEQSASDRQLVHLALLPRIGKRNFRRGVSGVGSAPRAGCRVEAAQGRRFAVVIWDASLVGA